VYVSPSGEIVHGRDYGTAGDAAKQMLLDNFLRGVALRDGKPGDVVDIDGAELQAADMERLIQYFGYEGHDIPAILKEVDLDRSETWNAEEFLKVMRIIIVEEALAMKETFLQVVDEKGFCPVDNAEMRRTIGALTGVVASEDKVREAVTQIGQGDPFFVLSQFKELAESLRKTYGFTEEDYDFYKEQFEYNDRDGTGAMSVVELGGLLKSMAIHLSLKERQAVLAVVDLSGDGELDFPEFLRLISLIRKEETKAVLEEGKKQAKKFDLDFDPGFMNKPSFPAQGFTKILQTVKLSDSALDEYIVSRELPRDEVWTIRELFDAVETVRHYEMDQIRTNAGYSQREVADFREKFATIDRDGSGTIEMKELMVLLREVNKEPRTLEEQTRLKTFLEDIRVPYEEKLVINFHGFLRMMRFFSDSDTERIIENEANAARRTGYSRRDIEKYRATFTTYSKDTGTLTVGEVAGILRSYGMTLTPDKTDSLRELCKTFSGSTGSQEKQSGTLAVQFDSFLLLIHYLRSSNFADINKFWVLES